MKQTKEDRSVSSLESLETAFWSLIAHHPLERISVKMLVEEANCSRGTFYYYFESIFDMAEKLIKNSLPLSIPQLLVGRITGSIEDFGSRLSMPDMEESLDRFCLLLSRDDSVFTLEKIKESIRQAWLDAFHISESELLPETRVIQEYAIGGIIGVLSYRAKSNFKMSLDECFNAIGDLVPHAMITTICRNQRLSLESI